jgi:uncharacterized protein YggU (UPF0235/DUF167 family)
MACSLSVKVIPRAGKQQCIIDKNGIIKIYLKSAPEGGAANAELIKLIAHALKIPQRDVIIATGATSRTKRLLITTKLSYEQVLTALGLEVQHAMV